MVFAVRHDDTFSERHIDRLEMRRDHRISSDIPEGARGRHDEGGGIVPSESLDRWGWGRQITGTHTRKARSVWKRIVCACIIETYCECQRHTALDCRVCAQLPATDNCIGKTVIYTQEFSSADWQVIDSTKYPAMANVK